jgi:hypothetical protein
MSVDVDIDEVSRQVVVRFEGVDLLWALQREQRLPFDVIAGARVVSREQAEADLSWRVGGGYWPGRVATGHFMVKGRKGARQLWLVFRDPEVLVIDTSLERPCRVVLQTPDRAELARRIDSLKDEERP